MKGKIPASHNMMKQMAKAAKGGESVKHEKGESKKVERAEKKAEKKG